MLNAEWFGDMHSSFGIHHSALTTGV
jgi:hypothetical protein